MKKEAPVYKIEHVSETATDFKIPKFILNNIEKKIIEEGIKSPPIYITLPFSVKLSSESLDVLTHPYLQIDFDHGGGKLDLKNYLIGSGTFVMSFPLTQFKENLSIQGIYYLSQAPQKNIDGESFGLGCGKMLDLLPKAKLLEKDNFLKLNTTNLRYLYVVSGYYVFVLRNKNQIYITHLNVTDSRYKDSLCPELK